MSWDTDFCWGQALGIGCPSVLPFIPERVGEAESSYCACVLILLPSSPPLVVLRVAPVAKRHSGSLNLEGSVALGRPREGTDGKAPGVEAS